MDLRLLFGFHPLYAIDDGDTVFAPGFKGLLKRACAIGRRRDGLADATLLGYRRNLDRKRCPAPTFRISSGGGLMPIHERSI